MDKVLMPLLDDNVKNVILNMKDIKIIDIAAAEHIASLQKRFYDSRASFVVCAFQPDTRKTLEKKGLFDDLNYTPTESEAADIVQMEEIEREFDES
jgi:anti-anti-sigma factor